MKRSILYVSHLTIYSFAGIFLISCQKEIRFAAPPKADHAFTIHFKPVVDNQALDFGSNYVNYFGETYSVRNFKFYVSQIELINTDSSTSYKVNDGDYFLINFADSSTVLLNLKAVPFTYNSISFTIGVDSLHNVSGAQTGALDPANGMFWTWNSGYIMAKLEGNSPLSNQPNQVFEYHIGGFQGPDNVVEKVYLSFPSGSLKLESGKSSEMTINANANAWFYNPNNISISSTPVCTTPGGLAKQVAENYSKMFTVIDFVIQ